MTEPDSDGSELKNPMRSIGCNLDCGEGGIRTPGTVTHTAV
jgi:hypothetical protein